MNNSDIYNKITDSILDRLAAGVIPWRRPWNVAGGGMPRNIVSKKPYRGVNIWLLMGGGYTSPFWGTFKQIKEAGGNVKKGEKSTLIVFWNIVKKEVATAKGKEEKKFYFLRYYNVFNACQCEGLEKFVPAPTQPVPEFQGCEAAESILANWQDAPTVKHGGAQAFYSPALDYIQLPDKAAFETCASYYTTRFHESAHATGHASRLDRAGVTDKGSVFGSTVYSREELVAEFAATYLCAESGIGEQALDNAAAYIEGWSRKLKSEPDLFLKAASEAQKAAEYILGAASVDGGEAPEQVETEAA